MTDAKQPAQFDWATELSDAEAHVSLSEQEAHEIGARLRSMGAKLKTYEDLGGAADDVQLLRMGYAAARLEIESLRKEHADELAVAYMCGASREKELAAQQGAAYAAQDSEHQMAIMEGERNASLDAYSRVVYLTSAESRLYESAFTSGWDRRDRLASHGQAPAAQALDDGCPHGSKHIVHDCMRCGAPVCCGKCCAEDAQAMDAREKLHTDVARAIWEVMREYEDSCDLELEDIGCSHVVWQLANAAIAAKQGGAA